MLTHILPLFLKASHLSFDGIDESTKSRVNLENAGSHSV